MKLLVLYLSTEIELLVAASFCPTSGQGVSKQKSCLHATRREGGHLLPYGGVVSCQGGKCMAGRSSTRKYDSTGMRVSMYAWWSPDPSREIPFIITVRERDTAISTVCISRLDRDLTAVHLPRGHFLISPGLCGGVFAHTYPSCSEEWLSSVKYRRSFPQQHVPLGLVTRT